MKALLGDHPVTRHFKAHSPLEFAEVKVLHTAFKRVVRDLEFDVAELALMTFLLAKAHGKPYRLLPAVLTARFQHATLAYNPERGALVSGPARGQEGRDCARIRSPPPSGCAASSRRTMAWTSAR